MRIYGIGIDIVEIGRIASAIARHGERFLARVFTEEERRYCAKMREPAGCYAARFAVKEAVSKALGTGIGADAGWLDLETRHDRCGKPVVILGGAAAKFAAAAAISEVIVSISHSEHYTVAQAIATAADS